MTHDQVIETISKHIDRLKNYRKKTKPTGIGVNSFIEEGINLANAINPAELTDYYNDATLAEKEKFEELEKEIKETVRYINSIK